MSITEAQRAELRKALPREAISQRDGGSGKKLSYLEGHYVKREMNRIFGNGAWSYRATVTKEYEGTNDKQQYVCTYKGVCVLTVGDCVIEEVGAGQGQDKRPGEAIEKAMKEAATDALKRCCHVLGDPLGLALYDKEQTHVADEPAAQQVSSEASILIDMLAAEPKKAQQLIREQWPKLNAADRAAIAAAIERQKKAA